jgi:hypothetical protein
MGMTHRRPGATLAIAFLLALVAALGAQPVDTIFYDDFMSNSSTWPEQSRPPPNGLSPFSNRRPQRYNLPCGRARPQATR